MGPECEGSFRSEWDVTERNICDCTPSMGQVTSLATLRIDLIPLDTRPRQSRALSSLPSQMPGRIWTGPSAYGAEPGSSPSPSSSLRWRMDDVEALGRETMEGLRRVALAGITSAMRLDGSEPIGLSSEAVEDCADGRVRESFFMFLEWGLLGGGQQKESASEVAEESAEAQVEASGSDTRATLGACGGVSIRRGVMGPFLREEKDDRKADCGRGVAVSIF